MRWAIIVIILICGCMGPAEQVPASTTSTASAPTMAATIATTVTTQSTTTSTTLPKAYPPGPVGDCMKNYVAFGPEAFGYIFSAEQACTISLEKDVEYCIATISKKEFAPNDRAKLAELCEEMTYKLADCPLDSAGNLCLVMNVLSIDDPAECGKVQDPSRARQCKILVAVNTEDPKLCGGDRSCLGLIAKRTGDASVCEGISDRHRKACVRLSEGKSADINTIAQGFEGIMPELATVKMYDSGAFSATFTNNVGAPIEVSSFTLFDADGDQLCRKEGLGQFPAGGPIIAKSMGCGQHTADDSFTVKVEIEYTVVEGDVKTVQATEGVLEGPVRES